MSHLIELRNRLMRAVAVWLIASIGCYLVAEDIYRFLMQPLAEVFAGEQRRMIATSLTETFVTYIKLAIYGGFFVSFPYIATEVYLFIAPGLYKRERRAVLPYLVAAPLLFFAGAALAYCFVMPKAWHFFVSFENPHLAGDMALVVEAKVSEYLSLVMQILLAFGLSFQLPVVLTLLVRVGLIETQQLAKGRRYAIVILATIAAIITPPDIISQILLLIPLYALYELSIVACRAIERRRLTEEPTHA
jgi:sec-independent protein translocase protein TatC